MLSKILITLLVVIAMMVFIKKSRKKSNYQVSNKSNATLNFSAIAIVGCALILSTSYGVWLYYDNNRVLNVSIISPSNQSSQHYQVRKKNIDLKQIKTIDGIIIRLSSLEQVIIADIE